MFSPDAETYRAYGRAMHAAQRLERSVANGVVATGTIRPDALRPRRVRTLGQLLRDLGKPAPVRGLENALELALQQRNWLAHRYFRYTGAGPGDVGRAAASLERLAGDFERLAKELGLLVEACGWESPAGDSYYLHSKTVRLKKVGEVEIVYFATDLRDGALRQMPVDREIVISAPTGFPLLKKSLRGDPAQGIDDEESDPRYDGND